MNNQNSAVLLAVYGNDERVCLSAWQSTGHELGIGDLSDINLEERLERLYIETVKTKKKSPHDLLMMLGEHGHHTPFEKVYLDFQCTADIASHIHQIKHRISSTNAESARYKELPDKWYLPDDWKNIHLSHDENIAVGHLLHDSMHSFGTWYDLLDHCTDVSHELYHLATNALTKRLGRKRAKESARYFLPYNKQLTYDFMINLRSFANFVHLRANAAAQKEIQEIAKSMLLQVYQTHQVDFSLEALGLLKYLPDEVLK